MSQQDLGNTAVRSICLAALRIPYPRAHCKLTPTHISQNTRHPLKQQTLETTVKAGITAETNSPTPRHNKSPLEIIALLVEAAAWAVPPSDCHPLTGDCRGMQPHHRWLNK